MTKSTKKSSKDFPSLENLPASSRPALCKHLSPSGANIASEPSNYSIVTATGSKRSSADSDSLLCHVRLWRTSRFRFGCASVCEHSEIKFALHNTHVTPHPPLSRFPFSHWRRLARCLVSLKTKLRIPAFDNFHRMLNYENVREIWLMGFVSLLQWGIDRFAKQTRSASPRLGQKVAAVG